MAQAVKEAFRRVELEPTRSYRYIAWVTNFIFIVYYLGASVLGRGAHLQPNKWRFSESRENCSRPVILGTTGSSANIKC